MFGGGVCRGMREGAQHAMGLVSHARKGAAHDMGFVSQARKSPAAAERFCVKITLYLLFLTSRKVTKERRGVNNVPHPNKALGLVRDAMFLHFLPSKNCLAKNAKHRTDP